MKTLTLKMPKIAFLFVCTTAFLATSCKKHNDPPAPEYVTYSNVSITPAQEVPSNNSSASGSITAQYDKTSNVLTYTINFTGITPTAMHFHKGAIGVSGGVERDIAGPYSSGMTGSVTLTDAQEADLLAGFWYVNMHTAALPAGEIRGQILSENLVVLSNVSLSSKQEVPMNTSAATGVFNGYYDKDSKKVTYTITLAGMTPTAMHIHLGAPGVSGGVIVDLSPSGGTTAALTSAQETDLLAGNMYVNVHTAANPAGEIRGQILKPSQVLFAAALAGSNEAPPVVSNASGSIYAVYDKATKQLSYKINYAGITPTVMHFHKAAIGVSAGVVKDIPGPYTSGFTGTVTLTADQETDLLSGLWYINMHSTAFPSGEIRAQMLK